jgi:asparagine N-glycosylation enzyme membrane subunit Stt3
VDSDRDAVLSCRMLRRAVPPVALALLAAGLVLYARVLPLSLPGVDPAVRADFEWVGPDGRTHVYLGDYDSYLWLRHARTLLATGTPCDAIVDGICWDTYAAAPVGRPTRYARSLHVYALAGLQRVVTLVSPRIPLSATAYWLPVIVGVLGVLPAFAIGRLLAGPVAGFAAAVVIGLNPLFLGRSIGADNDVWNVVLPLFAVWGATVALTGGSRPRRAGGAAGAAVATVLHAATWSGWVLTAAVVGVGLALGSLRRVAAAGRSGRPIRPAITDTGLSLLVFAMLALAGTAMVGQAGALVALPGRLLHFLLPAAAHAAAPAPLEWPNVFQTVGELSRSGLAFIAGSLGGQRYFFVAWLGLLLLVLPTHRWQWWHFVVLLAGNFLYAHLLRSPGLGTHTVIALVAAPLAAAVLLDLAIPGAGPDGATEDDRRAAALVVVIWFLGALSQAWVAIRFVMLLVPAFGIAFGVALGRLDGWAARLLVPRATGYGRRLRPVIAAAVLLATVPPVRDGLAAAERYRPIIDDAWWDALTEIRHTTPPDAIVTTWWDYGHWVKYVADRRTTADGSTLLTQAPYWIGRALLAPTEAETAGLLRMLNCGSASSTTGAWARLVAHGMEPIAAHHAVIELARRDRPRAAAWLAGRGLDAAAIDDVLQDTHCAAPASYLMLNSVLVGGGSWRMIGGWDPVRSWLVASDPATDRAATLTSRFGVAPDEADALVAEWDTVRAAGDPDARAEFEHPRQSWLVPGWLPCDQTGGGLDCPIDQRMDRQGTVLERVLIDPAHPEATRLRVRGPGASSTTDGSPATLVVARVGGVTHVVPDGPPLDTRLGALVDLRMRRVLLGAPDMVASTFAELWFLGGRDAPHFVRTDDRKSLRGERVITWRVRTGATGSSRSRTP